MGKLTRIDQARILIHMTLKRAIQMIPFIGEAIPWTATWNLLAAVQGVIQNAILILNILGVLGVTQKNQGVIQGVGRPCSPGAGAQAGADRCQPVKGKQGEQSGADALSERAAALPLSERRGASWCRPYCTITS